MKKILLLLLFNSPFILLAQSNFDGQITAIASEVVKKCDMLHIRDQKVAILEFYEVDGSLTYLGQFLSDEITSELVNKNDGNKRIEVINRDQIHQLLQNNNITVSTNTSYMAKTIGGLSGASVLVVGEISDFGNSYRLDVRLYTTRDGNFFASIKGTFDKAVPLTNYHDRVVSADQNQPIAENKKPADAPEQIKPKNCPTGDFCFENTSNKRKVIEVLGAENGLGGHDVLFTLTIPAGEKGCFYGIPAVVQSIIITTYDSELVRNPNGYGPPLVNEVTHRERRQIRVQNCANEADIKPLILR